MNENADLPRDLDRKPPASPRDWLVGAALAVTLLATALHPFSPDSLRDAAPQQILSIQSGALALTVERPAADDARPAPAKSAAPAGPANPNTRTHVVVRGDTLWDIAKKYVGDPSRYPELTELSNFRNPDLIYPGDIVRIELRQNRE